MANMYRPCSAPVGNQERYNQAPHTNAYRAFPMHSGTVPSKNPMPYGGLNTENGPLNNSVGQMPNQSTQVQSASVPPTSQVVNIQDHLQDLESQLVVFREKEISLNEKTNQLEEEKTVTFESLSTEKNKNLALEANISEFQVKVANLESELKTTTENFSSTTSDIACSKETYELKLKEFETALKVMKSENDNLSSQIKDFIETETALKETIKILEAEKENMSENLLSEIKKAEDLQINIEELKANLSTRESEICDRDKIICNLKTEVQDLRRTYEEEESKKYEEYKSSEYGDSDDDDGEEDSEDSGESDYDTSAMEDDEDEDNVVPIGERLKNSTTTVKHAESSGGNKTVSFYFKKLSQIMDKMLLLQNQNHSLLTANTPHHPANSFPQPPVSQPPSLNYQPYWQQQPPRLPHSSGTMYNHPPGQFIPNSNADNYSLPPQRNTTYVDRTMPPHEQPNQSNKISNKDKYPPTNQANKPLPYSNGTGFVPPVSQYGHPPNSRMHARYLQSSLSPNISQSNVSSSTGATQFNQASNTLLPQNRMGSLPQPPAAQKRRLDPDNIPSPISCSTTDTNSISYCNTSSASMPSPLPKRKCITAEKKNIMDILRCKPVILDEWLIAYYKDGLQLWYSMKRHKARFFNVYTEQYLSIDEHPELMKRFQDDLCSISIAALADRSI